jgi:hypothetical protein
MQHTANFVSDESYDIVQPMQDFHPIPFTWVMAQLCDVWMTAWYKGQSPSGRYIVEFTDEGRERIVSELRPLVGVNRDKL